jgi:zinc transport system substrate-binding protein
VRYRPAGPLLVLSIALVLATSACSESSPERAGAVNEGEGERLSIYAVNYPLQYLAQRIAGGHADVALPLPGDIDPAFWSPSPDEVAAFQGADLILLNGAGYAAWVKQASLPRRKLVDTGAGFREQWIAKAGSPLHTHGPEGEHSHAGWAFTTWLDPELAILQARAIEQALGAVLPERAPEFRANLEALAADIAELDTALEQTASRIGRAPILFSHPVYQYLERRYGLNGRSLHWEPDVAPAESEWRGLEAALAEHPAGWMIWEAPPLSSTRERLAALGIGVVVYSPCSNVPRAGDWLSVMLDNAKRLAAATSRLD